jgi:hypothetical protein
VKLRKPPDEDRSDETTELERCRRKLRRSLAERAAVDERLAELADLEAELNADDVRVALGECDSVEHQRRRQQLDRDKVEGERERDRLDRVVDGLQTRCVDLIDRIAEQRNQDVFSRRRRIEREVEELHAKLAALETGYHSTEAQLQEISRWRQWESRDGGLGRPDEPPPVFTEEEAELVRTAPGVEEIVRLPSGQAAYGRWPNGGRVVNPTDPLR